MRIHFSALLASLLGALTLSACSPAQNWRDVAFEGSALKAQLPCKPDRTTPQCPLGWRACGPAGCGLRKWLGDGGGDDGRLARRGRCQCVDGRLAKSHFGQCPRQPALGGRAASSLAAPRVSCPWPRRCGCKPQASGPMVSRWTWMPCGALWPKASACGWFMPWFTTEKLRQTWPTPCLMGSSHERYPGECPNVGQPGSFAAPHGRGGVFGNLPWPTFFPRWCGPSPPPCRPP